VAIVTAPFRKEPPTYIDWPNAGASAGLLVGGYLLEKAGFQVASKVVSGAGGALAIWGTEWDLVCPD
jgi:hypothetical protein